MLKIFHFITKRFSQGEEPLCAYQIANKLEIPIRFVKKILYELIDIGLVIESTKGVSGEIVFQPAKTIENMTIKSVFDEYENFGISKIHNYQIEDVDKISIFLKDISEAVEKLPSNIKIIDI